ncbi:MAG: anhydro-N-acetylmuramic acid kinase [Hymenobacter sp.]
MALAARHYLGPRPAAEVLLSGGGVHNAALLAALARHLPIATFRSTAEAGVPPDAKEALLFAVLANETLAGKGGLSLGEDFFAWVGGAGALPHPRPPGSLEARSLRRGDTGHAPFVKSSGSPSPRERGPGVR